MNTRRSVAIVFALLVTAPAAQAGNFVDLRTDLDPLSQVNGGLVAGANSQLSDKLYIESTSATYLPGRDDTRGPLDGGDGDVVATSITYRAFTGTTTIGSGTLTLLDWRLATDVPLAAGVAQGSIYDFVYRDSADNKLVFGSRYINAVDNDQEINYLYRFGFSGWSTSVAWTFLTGGDLRLYQSGRTASNSNAVTVPFDADSVRQKSDISVTEGNPWSGLFLVKTDAPQYVLGNSAIGFFQAGEEGQAKVGGSIPGFVPAPIPEPQTYAMLMVGLACVGFALRRRPGQR